MGDGYVLNSLPLGQIYNVSQLTWNLFTRIIVLADKLFSTPTQCAPLITLQENYISFIWDQNTYCVISNLLEPPVIFSCDIHSYGRSNMFIFDTKMGINHSLMRLSKKMYQSHITNKSKYDRHVSQQ